MRHLTLLALAVFLLPAAGFGQKKEVLELQREMALVQDKMGSLQRSIDEKFAALTALVQQSLESSNKANTSVAVSERGLGERMERLERNVAAPVTGFGTKIDQMAGELQAVRTEVADLTTRLGKVQAQLTDVDNNIRSMQERPAPPTTGAALPGSPSGPPPGMTAVGLYDNARRDMGTGNADLALAQFNDYLRYYGDTDRAPNAQFYIGEIHFNRKQHDDALKSFDAVLERYPENNKTPDAMYMKGKTLIQMGQRTAAAEEFRQLMKKYPKNGLADQSAAQLKALGLSANTAPAKATRRR